MTWPKKASAERRTAALRQSIKTFTPKLNKGFFMTRLKRLWVDKAMVHLEEAPTCLLHWTANVHSAAVSTSRLLKGSTQDSRENAFIKCCCYIQSKPLRIICPYQSKPAKRESYFQTKNEKYETWARFLQLSGTYLSRCAHWNWAALT